MLARGASLCDIPNGFRDSFPVDLLSRGASLYDVAKLLADTVDTVEKHTRLLFDSSRAGAADHGNRRRTRDNAHTVGTRHGAKSHDTLKKRERVADEPVSRILWGTRSCEPAPRRSFL